MSEKYDLDKMMQEIPEDEKAEQEGRLKQLTHEDIRRMVEESWKARHSKRRTKKTNDPG